MNVTFEYAVKVVCGRSDGEVVAPGTYWTAINIHNPERQAVRLRWKIAVALPRDRGPVTPFVPTRLGSDEALEIDCPEIVERAGVGEFVKGFVVVECGTPLDVVAVYTAAGRDENVSSIDVETVPGRRVEMSLPDLVPVPGEDGNFCRPNDGELTVTVRNQGTGPAGPSVTEVDFGRYGVVTQPTPPLGAGDSVDLVFMIPPRCFDPDCQFTITVDANNDVVESNETNNVAQGTCLG